ncbi:MAG: oligoendopeptidase F [Lachnospiraceae bacterium]|nr:oligoendopeptidase F [Lachnospiraceae bacterium]
MSDKLVCRNQVLPEDKWAIEDLYVSDELWQADYDYVEDSLEKIEEYKGKLGLGTDVFEEFIGLYKTVECCFEKVYVYANEKMHEDTANEKYQKMAGMAAGLESRLSTVAAFLEPEILSIDESILNDYMAKDELAYLKQFIDDITRNKKYTLSEGEERLLAMAGEMAGVPENVFGMFNNADIRFPKIEGENGEEIEITHGRYTKLLESKDVNVRKAAFMGLYSTYKKSINTLGATYCGQLITDCFYAKARGYESTMKMHLNQNNIPLDVYKNLIATVKKALPLLHRYVALRKKALGLEELHMYDLYTPLIDGDKEEYDFDKSRKIVEDALKCMGEEYVGILKEGFENGWIDKYENRGKRSGAYSWGAYGTHPYVLLNHQGNLNSVFTLAHEMGHAIHTYYSSKTQDYIYAGYKIFVAEVASTCNEALLINYLMNTTDSKEKKAYLINYYLEQFRGTLFRQTMFAEFEMIVHEKAMNNESLNASQFNEIYYNLNKEYFGDDIVIDEEIAYEWARIPHFYSPFYVYQYATGFSAAIAFANRILSGNEEYIDAYKGFLKAGCSKYPIDILKDAGIDMSKTDAIESALRVFEDYLNRLEEVI